MSKCQCTFSIKMLGDGCRYCQPQEYIDRLIDNYEAQVYELKEVMYYAIRAGDWKVDGACDPSELLEDFDPCSGLACSLLYSRNSGRMNELPPEETTL